MKKKAALITVLFVTAIIAVAVGLILILPKNMYEDTFTETVTVVDTIPQKAQLVREIEVDKAGEYIFCAEWEVDTPGLLINCRIADKNGNEINQFGAECISMTSGAMEYEEGIYTMTLTFLTTEEQYTDFYADCDEASWDVKPEEECLYEFAENGEFHITFDFGLKKNNFNDGKVMALFIVLCCGAGIMLAIAMVMICQKGTETSQKYDERQELLRGRGFKYGFFTMLMLNGVMGMIESSGIPLSVEAGVMPLINLMLGVAVFAVYCIWKEAYIALNTNAKRTIGLFVILGITNFIIGVGNIQRGEAIVDGKLTIMGTNLGIAVLAFLLCVTMMLKKLSQSREEE